jgi:hypothetical protein
MGNIRKKDDNGRTVVVEKSILVRTICMAVSLIDSNVIDICDGKKNDMPEYKEAQTWARRQTDLILQLEQGWARCPTREEGMYGPSYITEEFQDIFEECVA